MNSLLVNLSFLIAKPTGHTAYAVNLLPHLQSLNPTLLISPLAPNPPAPFPPREGGVERGTIDSPLLVGEGSQLLSPHPLPLPSEGRGLGG